MISLGIYPPPLRHAPHRPLQPYPELHTSPFRSSLALSVTTMCNNPSAEPCWICLEEGSAEQPVECHCACPRPSHRACLARWQIQQVGRSEENCCRFCSQQLPKWSDSLLPESHAAQAKDATAVMAVVYKDTVYKIAVKPGPDGEAEFKAAVKSLFGFPHDMEFDVTFEVKLPAVPGHALPATNPDSSLVLRGLTQFGTAATCAQASAVARSLQKTQA